MKEEHRRFLDKMITECKTHTAWLTIVNFGLPTLLENQDVLVELIINEARRLSEHNEGEAAGVGGTTPIEAVRRILGELNLRLVVS